jgi:predicted PurR-regulated permease PerM
MNTTRPAIFWIAILATIIVIAVLLRGILLPFAAGIVLAYVLDPLANRLERLGLGRLIATLVILGLFIIGGGIVIFLTARFLVRELVAFFENSPLPRSSPAMCSTTGAEWLPALTAGYHRRMAARSERLLAKRTIRSVASCADKVRICLILSLAYAVTLTLIGLNHGLLIGIVAGVISFVPYLGSLTALIVSMCIATAQFWPSWPRWLRQPSSSVSFSQTISYHRTWSAEA